MGVDAKHIATFLLGAAAGLAAHKYMTMTPEEKEKLASDIKDKAHEFKNEAENAAGKAKDYFDELKAKGTDTLKEHFSNAESMLHNLFGTKQSTPQEQETKTSA
ncbi:MAG TPA: YtxH domain-containing protein [Puia sp.]|nr:YtxH domain-containing protein [Puia sp.]